MIIKSYFVSDYRKIAQYMKAYGENEKTRLVKISDVDAHTLDQAFWNMWAVAYGSKAHKALHHISINPDKDERLTDQQVEKIVRRCEKSYGYKYGDHQHVVVEHIKKGRQHFHVVWNRVSLSKGLVCETGRDWIKSKYIGREIEKEFGLKTPLSRRARRVRALAQHQGRVPKTSGRYQLLKKIRVDNADLALDQDNAEFLKSFAADAQDIALEN